MGEELMVGLDAIIDEIADRVAARVLEKLDRVAASSAPVVYSTHKAGQHFPGKSRAWMLEHVAKMPGARKVGRDWVIAAVDYDAWVAAEDGRRVKLASQPKAHPAPKRAIHALPSNDTSYPEGEAELHERASRSLAALGLRRSR